MEMFSRREKKNYESYRHMMQVVSKRMVCSSYYAVCPRCGSLLERDYAAFCDRCGQHLGWTDYGKAVIIGLCSQV